MKATLLITGAAAAALAAAAAGAQQAGGYAEDLGRVYEATQFIQAIREGCETAHPASRQANEAAYNAWRKRHRALIDELDRRFMAMIRGASTSQGEYSRNVGKYAGEALHHLEELKAQFLSQPAAEVSRQCEAYPQYLAGKDADLAKRFAAELKSIRRRKL